MFIIHSIVQHYQLNIIASNGLWWEHVSVSVAGRRRRPLRTPTWEEMCYVKALFWEPEETVLQYHPPESEYINCHSHTLHLWKPVGVQIPLPPSILVGPKRTRR
jgi:hypothetical protein